MENKEPDWIEARGDSGMAGGFDLAQELDSMGLLEEAMADALSCPPEMMVWEWLERWAYLGPLESATPGPFKIGFRTYMKEPLECYRDKTVRDLILCFGTQVGKTLTIMGGTAWKIANDPMNGLWIMPNTDLAESFSKSRWIPFIDGIEPLRKLKHTGKGFFRLVEQFFARCILNFVGSNSPANLASRPAGLLNMDEVDKFAQKSSKEAGALQNAEERAKTFPYPLKVKTSTPTTEYGEIWQEFLKGDQRYYNLPCPHCEKLIVLKWEQVRWWETGDEKINESKVQLEDGSWVWDEELVRKNAFYRCQECEGKILDHHKYDMLIDPRAKWIPTNLRAMLGTRSYHLNSLYAPLKECSFGILAVKWINSKASMTRRQAFINSTLAEPFDEEKAIDDEPLTTTIYTEDTLPEKRIPQMTVDVQDNHFWVDIRAWGSPKAPGGQQSWLLYYDKAMTREEVEELALEYKVAPKRVVVDMAHKPNMVSAWIVKNGWRGLWGTDKLGFNHKAAKGTRVIKEFSPIQFRDPHLGTVNASERNLKAMFLYWANDPIKNRLDAMMNGNPIRWHVPPNVSPEYIRQMNSEAKELKVDKRTGRKVWFWKRKRRDNHAWDCEAMQIAAGLAGGLIEDTAAGYLGDAHESDAAAGVLDENGRVE